MIDCIDVSSNLVLNQISESDAHDLVTHIGHTEVSSNVLQVPHPYLLSDAISWVKFVQSQKEAHGELVNWAIRLNGEVIGGIGLHKRYPNQPHKDEFGYWIGPAHWNKGIGTQVVGRYVEHLFTNTPLIRLEAPIFKHNVASQRVLEKNGFVHEGTLRQAYLKDGTYLDALYYARLK